MEFVESHADQIREASLLRLMATVLITCSSSWRACSVLLVQQQIGEVVGGSCQGRTQHSEGVPRHGRLGSVREAVGDLVELGRLQEGCGC